jgi:hypothetical protein
MPTDLEVVRNRAQQHADAIVAGDLGRAAQDLTEAAQAAAPAVMKGMQRPVTSAAVDSVSADGDEAVALIVYSGDDREHRVESRWSDQSGELMITALRVGP